MRRKQWYAIARENLSGCKGSAIMDDLRLWGERQLRKVLLIDL